MDGPQPPRPRNDETEELTINVEPGLALDCCGRQVVSQRRTPKTLEPPSPSGTTTIHLYLTYEECVKESVPVSGAEGACDEECEYNRVLEIFDVEYGNAPPPEYKTPPPIDFPEPPEGDQTADEALRALLTMARSYYEDAANDDELRACKSCEATLEQFDTTEPPVFLGTFTKPTEDGEWTRDESVDRRFAYTTDMLHAAIARHVTHYDNPHAVTAGQVGALVSVEGVEGDDDGNVDFTSPDDTVSLVTASGEVGDNTVGFSVTGLAELREQHEADVETLTDRLDGLERRHDEEFDALRDRIVRLEHYVMERSVWCKCSSFAGVAGEFESQTAREIVGLTEAFLNDFGVDDRIQPGEYFTFIGQDLRFDEDQSIEERLVEELRNLENPPDQAALGRFETTVDRLRGAYEERDEENVLPVAAAQDEVCKAARCLARRRIIPL